MTWSPSVRDGRGSEQRTAVYPWLWRGKLRAVKYGFGGLAPKLHSDEQDAFAEIGVFQIGSVVWPYTGREANGRLYR